MKNKEHHTLGVDRFNYQLIERNQKILSVGMERLPDSNAQFKVEAENYSLLKKRMRAWDPGAPVRFYGFPDEVLAYNQNADFVQELNLCHEKLFRTLNYLGPLRTKTSRLYAWSGNEPESVGYTGENTIAAILAARERKIGSKYPGARRASDSKPFEQVIASKLKDMGLIDHFKVNRISNQRHEYEVQLQIKGSDAWVGLPDVGVGVSQVLPVLTECYYAPPKSIIIMEQPEIHLHPSAQSALADVMIDVIYSREYSEDRGIQLIIETHSEHFLRRLQRRIAEDVISPESIAVYFADVQKSSATLTPLEIDPYGNIRNWPPNFFGDEMGDITSQSEAAMNKRMQQRSDSREEGNSE